jgi:hypothetical protein
MTTPASVPDRHVRPHDRTTVLLTVGAVVLALPLMGHALVVLSAALSAGRTGAVAAGVSGGLLLLPMLGALSGWGYARLRRYPPARVWRHAALGGLVVSALADLAVLAMLVLLVVALG